MVPNAVGGLHNYWNILLNTLKYAVKPRDALFTINVRQDVTEMVFSYESTYNIHMLRKLCVCFLYNTDPDFMTRSLADTWLETVNNVTQNSYLIPLKSHISKDLIHLLFVREVHMAGSWKFTHAAYTCQRAEILTLRTHAARQSVFIQRLIHDNQILYTQNIRNHEKQQKSQQP